MFYSTHPPLQVFARKLFHMYHEHVKQICLHCTFVCVGVSAQKTTFAAVVDSSACQVGETALPV